MTRWVLKGDKLKIPFRNFDGVIKVQPFCLFSKTDCLQHSPTNIMGFSWKYDVKL